MSNHWTTEEEISRMITNINQGRIIDAAKVIHEEPISIRQFLKNYLKSCKNRHDWGRMDKYNVMYEAEKRLKALR